MGKPNISELDFRSQSQYDADEIFQKSIDTIDEKHKEYFALSKSKYRHEPLDHVRNYFSIYSDNGVNHLIWDSNNKLSEEIRIEIENAFKKSYNS